MISANQAKQIIFRNTKPLVNIEKVGFLNSLHRCLVQDIRATTDLPPFDRATVDGFAVRSSDIKSTSRAKGGSFKIFDSVT